MEIHSLSDQDRLAIIGQHPVITKDYLIITPVITNAYSVIRERVFMRSTGTFMYATPRMGKTTCAKAVKFLLEVEFPNIYIMRFVAQPKRKQEAGIFIDILNSDGICITKRAGYLDFERQLLTHIQTRLAMASGTQFVLMIDEMQYLGDSELEKLATIHNKLELCGIRMTTIGFAQPEILDLRSSLKFLNKKFLISRFLCEPIQFFGCTSKEDLIKILRDYDAEKYFPPDSNYSFTNFFLPKAFENGFKLSSYSDQIWKELKKAAGQSSESIPMEHLTRTVEHLLVSSHLYDAAGFELNAEVIQRSVGASNLANFNGFIS